MGDLKKKLLPDHIKLIMHDNVPRVVFTMLWRNEDDGIPVQQAEDWYQECPIKRMMANMTID